MTAEHPSGAGIMEGVEPGSLMSLVRTSPMPSAVLAVEDVLDRTPVGVNAPLCELLGLDEADAMATTLRDALVDEPDEEQLAELARLVDGEVEALQLSLELRRAGATGSGEVPVELLLSRFSADGCTMLLAQCLDMTDREEESRALAAAEERLRLTFEHAPIGMAVVSNVGVIEDANGAFCRLLARDRNQLIGLNVVDVTHPEDRTPDLQLMDELVSGRRDHYRIDKRYLRPDGSVVWGELTVAMVRSPAGDPLYFVSQIVDVTERRQRESDLRERTLRDPLTEVANRRALFEAYARLAHEQPGRSVDPRVGVLFCDLDRFKEANDRGGHVVGDQLLRMVAQRIQHTIRPTDLLARHGGDEFVVLCRVGDEDDATRLAERIVACFDEPFTVAGQVFDLSVSVGVSVGDPEDDADARIAAADGAMYLAKRSGRRIEVARPG